mgnify:CR=1 FL=1
MTQTTLDHDRTYEVLLSLLDACPEPRRLQAALACVLGLAARLGDDAAVLDVLSQVRAACLK